MPRRRTIRPDQVPAPDAERILAFLNGAADAREVDEAVDIPGVPDIGMRLAQRILDRREELGGFTTLQQLMDVPLIGPRRFTQLVTTLSDFLPSRRGGGGRAEVAALREELRALRAGLGAGAEGAALRITLTAVNDRPYLGQAVTLLVRASRGAEGTPVVGLPVTLLATWGEFQTPRGAALDRGRSTTVVTGLDGRGRVRLFPSSREPMLGEHSAALEGALERLPLGASTPADAEAPLLALVDEYRSPPSVRLREAIDLLVEDLGGPALDPVVLGDVMDGWPTLDATVLALAREGGDGAPPGSTVGGVAAIPLQLRNWLPAWLSLFARRARAGGDLDQRLGGLLGGGATGEGYLLVAAMGRIRGYVEAQRGRVGDHFGRIAAEASIRRLLQEELGSLPLESRLTLRNGLGAALGAVTTQGAVGLGVLEREQQVVRLATAPIRESVRELEGSVGSLAQLDVRLAGVEAGLGSVRDDFANLGQHPALAGMNATLATLNQDLGAIRSRLDGIQTDLVRIDGRLEGITRDFGQIDGRVTGLATELNRVDTRVGGLTGQVTDLNLRLGSGGGGELR